MKRGMIFLFVVLTLAATMLDGRQVGAALGEPADSVAKDSRALAAVRHATVTHNAYTVQEITTESATIREYITSSGIVFAVAWNGISHPDLTLLLGSFVGDFQQAQQKMARQRGQRQSRVKGDRVVVEKWGHMRNLQGRAYLPELLPAGVTVDEIK